MYTIELVTNQKKVAVKDKEIMRQTRQDVVTNQNNRNRINTAIDGKYNETKNRFKQMQLFARKIA